MQRDFTELLKWQVNNWFIAERTACIALILNITAKVQNDAFSQMVHPIRISNTFYTPNYNRMTRLNDHRKSKNTLTCPKILCFPLFVRASIVVYIGCRNKWINMRNVILSGIRKSFFYLSIFFFVRRCFPLPVRRQLILVHWTQCAYGTVTSISNKNFHFPFTRNTQHICIEFR